MSPDQAPELIPTTSEGALFEASVLHASMDGYLRVASDGRIIDANQAATSLLGYSKVELLSLHIHDIDAEDDREAVQVRTALARRDGSIRFHTRHCTKDGRVRDMDVSVTFVPATGDMVSFFRDVTEQRAAEALLWLQAAGLDQSLDMVTVTDLSGRILYVNQAQAKVLGKSRAELVGQPTEVYAGDPDGVEAQRGIIQETVDKGEWRGEVVNAGPDGSRITVDLRVSLIRDLEGRSLALVGVGTDVSANRAVEAELRDLNRHLRAISLCKKALIHASNEERLLQDICCIAVEEADYRLAWVGYVEHDEAKSVRPVAQAGFEAGYLETLQITWADTERGQGPTGTAIRSGLPSSCRNIHSDPCYAPWRAEAIKRGYASSLVLPLKSGGEVFGTINFYAVSPEAFGTQEFDLLSELADNLAYGIQTLRTRRAREQSEDALRSAVERFRQISEAAGEWIWELDPQGLYTYASPVVENLLGFAPEELVGKVHFYDLFPPVERDLLTPKVFEAFRRREAIYGLPNTVIHKDGREILLETTGLPILGPAGDLIGYRGVDRDMTAQRRAEADQHRMEKELNHLHRLESLGRLVSGVSHDMNNVLSAIMAVANLLKLRHGGDPVLDKDAEVLLQASARGRDLVKGLRDFSRKELDAATDLDLNELARQEADLLERTSFKKVSIQLHLEGGLPKVFGEASSISNALMNLCINAFDAMPNGGRLTLLTRNLGQGFVSLTVQDTGEGMSPEVRARALEPFYTTKPAGKGTGLGLSQVYGTMKVHGGSVDIQSIPGEGTQVSLLFPSAQTAHLGAPVEDVSRAPARRKLQLLLVDDDDLVRLAIQTMVEAAGHQVLPAGSGKEALGQIEGGAQADLVVLDINMPGMDGIETLRRLRGQRPDLPVLLMSGYLDERASSALSLFNNIRILRKPFTLSDLNQVISDWV